MSSRLIDYEDTDRRLFVLKYDPEYFVFLSGNSKLKQPFPVVLSDVVELVLTQVEFLRLLRLTRRYLSSGLTSRLESFVEKCDKVDGHITDFNRQLPRPRYSEKSWRGYDGVDGGL